MTALTVMIRSSAWGAYFLLVNRERTFIRTRALIQDRVLFSFLRNSRMCRTKLLFLSKKNREDWKTDLLSLDHSQQERPTKQQSSQNFEITRLTNYTLTYHITYLTLTETQTTVFLMRLLTSREALIEKWALIGTTVVYRIITECLFLLSNFTNAANLGGGGKIWRGSFSFFQRIIQSP